MDNIDLKDNKLTLVIILKQQSYIRYSTTNFNFCCCLKVDEAAYYIPNFITEEQEAYIMDKVNSAPKPKWCQLKNRRLQNWGGIPHAKGLIPETIPDVSMIHISLNYLQLWSTI